MVSGGRKDDGWQVMWRKVLISLHCCLTFGFLLCRGIDEHFLRLLRLLRLLGLLHSVNHLKLRQAVDAKEGDGTEELGAVVTVHLNLSMRGERWFVAAEKISLSPSCRMWRTHWKNLPCFLASDIWWKMGNTDTSCGSMCDTEPFITNCTHTHGKTPSHTHSCHSTQIHGEVHIHLYSYSVTHITFWHAHIDFGTEMYYRWNTIRIVRLGQ